MRALSAARSAGSRNSGDPPGDPMSVEWLTSSEAQGLEPLREPPRMGLLGFGERLEPFGNLLEALAAGRLAEARVHLGELVGLTVDGGLEVLLRRTDRQTGHGVARLLQEIEMPERVSRLGLGRVAEQATDVRIPFDVSAPRKVEIAPVGLRLTGERILQVLVGACPLQRLRHRVLPP